MLDSSFNLGRGRVRWERIFFFISLIAVPAILSSCGSTPTATVTPTITVSCIPTSVTVLGTAQCTANVLNATSTLVNWSVSGSTNGSITSGGLYTAPATVPSTNIVTITATSQVQSTLTATSSLTIVAATAITAVVCNDSSGSSPSPLIVSSLSSLSCTAFASVSTGTTVPVNWSVSNTNHPGVLLNLGGISTLGSYTAPLVPPPGQTVTITATSKALATETMSVTATVVFGNAVLSGPYAFSTSGRLPNSNDFFARVGSFSAGGGQLIGTEDSNQGGASGGVKQQRNFTGAYSVGPDGRGTMQFCEDSNGVPCPFGSASATAFFRIVVVSPQRAQIIEFSPPASSSAVTTASGEMLSQDPSVFGAGDGNLAGTYTFNFYGVSSASAFESALGEFTANGFGTISAGTLTTPGEMAVDAGVPQTLATATYSISSNGRGSGPGQTPVTIGGLNFIFYVVSASHSKFIQVDPSSVSILAGDAYKQQSGVTCGWGSNALGNSVVLETAGASSGVEIADVGSFTATTVTTTNGNVTAGSMDENSGGTVPPPQIATLTGAYTVDPCGRGGLSIGSHTYIFYPISTASAVLQETTSGIVARGFLVQSQGGPIVDASLNGSYALRLSGTNAAGAPGRREDVLGQITSDGNGKLTGGSLDINDFGATTAGVANTGTYLPDASPATTLRAVAHLTSAPSLVLYMVSPTLFYVLDADPAPAGTAVGVIDNQF